MTKIRDTRIANFNRISHDKFKEKISFSNSICPLTKKDKKKLILTEKNNFDIEDFGNLVKRISNKNVEYFTSPKETPNTKIHKINHRTLTSVSRLQINNSLTNKNIKEIIKLNSVIENSRKRNNTKSNAISIMEGHEISGSTEDFRRKINTQNISKEKSIGLDEFNDEEEVKLLTRNPFTSFKENTQLLSSVSFFDNQDINNFSDNNQRIASNDFYNSQYKTFNETDNSHNLNSNLFIKTVENFKPLINETPIKNPHIRKNMNTQCFSSYSSASKLNNNLLNKKYNKPGLLQEYCKISQMVKTKTSFKTHLFSKVINEYCQPKIDKKVNNITKPKCNKEQNANIVDCLSYDNLKRLYSKIFVNEKGMYTVRKGPKGKYELFQKNIRLNLNRVRIPLDQTKQSRNLVD